MNIYIRIYLEAHKSSGGFIAYQSFILNSVMNNKPDFFV